MGAISAVLAVPHNYVSLWDLILCFLSILCYYAFALQDDACVQKVKELYIDLGIEKVFKDYEEESYARLVLLMI